MTFDSCTVVGRDIPRDQWLAKRATGIGASEVASVLGVGFETPVDVWLRKAGLASDEDLAAEVERIHWGQVLEPVIIEQYATDRYAGRPTTRSGELLRSTAHPWALATLDAVTVHPSRGLIPLETKATDAFLANAWEDGPPERYYLQVQAQMLVTGVSTASIASLIGGNRLVWCDIERDEATIARIVHACSRFWELVQSRTMPPPDASAEWARAFAIANPESADVSVVALDDDARRWADELAAAKVDEKRAKERSQRAKNEIIARVGAASEARFRDGSGFTYRTQTRAEHTVSASTFRVLRESAAPKKNTSKRSTP